MIRMMMTTTKSANKEEAMREKKVNSIEELNQEIRAQKIISQRCAQRINKNLNYLKDNAGSIAKHETLNYIFPGDSHVGNFVKSLTNDNYYPRRKKGFPRNKFTHNSGLYYLSIAEQFLPKMWPILKPIIYTYGLKKIKKLLIPSFLCKKK